MKNYLLLTVLLICCFLAGKSQNNDPIILSFQPLDAKVSNNKLQVEWTVPFEKNIKQYDIQVSKDGKAFSRIGMVLSKAEGGNSASPLTYTFTTHAGGFVTMSVLFLFTFLNFSTNKFQRKGTMYIITGLCIGAMGFGGCRKSEVAKTENLYLRVSQIDNANHALYSKVVKVL